MTKVAILPVSTHAGSITYRAVAGERHSEGKTAGEALDALTRQLPEVESGTLIIVQNLLADQFFSVEQQARLSELMERWRRARDSGESLRSNEQSELDGLVEAELRASAKRTEMLLKQLSE